MKYSVVPIYYLHVVLVMTLAKCTKRTNLQCVSILLGLDCHGDTTFHMGWEVLNVLSVSHRKVMEEYSYNVKGDNAKKGAVSEALQTG